MNRKFNDQEQIRREKLQKLIDLGLNPYHHEKFLRNTNSQNFKNKYANIDKEILHRCNDRILIAGRVMAIRQTFGVIQDFYGTVQFYINKKTFDPKLFDIFKNLLDLGDIIGITGTPMKTNTGEVTVRVEKFVILAKCLIPLPEKYHGLNNEEIRARKRYVDLITSRESMNIFVDRINILKYIRQYMDNIGYYEAETPILTEILGGAAAKPFITHHNALNRDYYLRIATELALKKLIVGGFEKVYEIGRIFRNEGIDTTHNPEFTSIEAYEAYANLEDMMNLAENLIKFLAKKLNRTKVVFRGHQIDLTKPFIRINILDLIKQETNIDFWSISSNEQAVQLAKQHEIELLPHQKTLGHVINAFFEKYCEQKCIQPTFVIGHPLDVSPLAKKNQTDQRFTRRFELFISTKEFANAFSELNDPIDQLERFENQIKEKDLGNEEANEIDMSFIDALEYGLPPTGGIGIGIDRLVMLLTGQESIRNVLLFPHMKEENN